MKKNAFSLLSSWKGVALIGSTAILAACGDSVENVYQTGLEVFSSEKDLPKCSEKNEGDQAVVKGETSIRVCLDGEWVAMGSDDSGSEVSCKTVELKDKSGLKIVCNGDSIGVVLNGADGKDGKDAEVAKPDTVAADSEKVPVSLDSLVGVTQKGPFLKGSTVYLYELSDGRTLKQTNGNFTSNISQDNGRYKFLARDLVSQYAMVVVDGYYRNEVTGVSSNAPIRLKAITDMRKRSSVNVNLLTHLEFERVYQLVTRGDPETGEKLTVKQAKRKAQREILKLFDIELDDKSDAEDMDVFGSSDADAALLAISILLQGDRTESDLMSLLSSISQDLADDGEWNDSAAKAEIADWAFSQDLAKIRKNVTGWGLNASGEPVGNFEKYVNNFIAVTFNIDTCTAATDTPQTVKNSNSAYNENTYKCYEDWNDGKLKRITWVEERPNEYLNDDVEYGHIVDWRNRRMYRTITLPYGMLGKTRWMAEDLDLDYRVNGKSFGSSVKSGRRTYSWAATMDSAGSYNQDGLGCGAFKTCVAEGRVRGLCPEGWHVPMKDDWEELIQRVDGIYGEGMSGEVLKSKKGWRCDNNGSDSTGFSAIPRDKQTVGCGEGVNDDRPTFVDFWSATEIDAKTAYSFKLPLKGEALVVRDGNGKGVYKSLRCREIPPVALVAP